MSSRSSSVPTSTGGEGMSHYDDAASELGRRLRLDPSSTSDDMRTRLQAQMEAQKQASATTRAPVKPSSSKGKGKAKAPAESSSRRQQPARPSKGVRRGASPDDDDDDDDDDSDDDSDDEHPPQARARDPVQERRARVVLVMSAFEPNRASAIPSEHLSPWEFYRTDHRLLDGRNPTQAFRRLADAVASSVNTDNELRLIEAAAPPNGSTWGSLVSADLFYRYHKTLTDYDSDSSDAIRAIEEFLRIFKSVEDILRHPYTATIAPVYKQHLIDTLTYIIIGIAQRTVDIRGTRTAAVTYTGGQYEHNLYYRFASTKENWTQVMVTMRRLAENHAALLKNGRAYDNLVWVKDQILDLHRDDQNCPTSAVREFKTSYSIFMQSLGLFNDHLLPTA